MTANGSPAMRGHLVPRAVLHAQASEFSAPQDTLCGLSLALLTIMVDIDVEAFLREKAGNPRRLRGTAYDVHGLAKQAAEGQQALTIMSWRWDCGRKLSRSKAKIVADLIASALGDTGRQSRPRHHPPGSRFSGITAHLVRHSPACRLAWAT